MPLNNLMHNILKNIGLFALLTILSASFLNVRPAFSFGQVVEHVLFAHEQGAAPYGEPVRLVEKQHEILSTEQQLHQEMLTSAGMTAKIRETLGDNRTMYEKDRLIETLKDYDTIMRSLLYFQTRNKDIIVEQKNRSFTKFNQQLRDTVANASGSGSASSTTAVGQILRNIVNNPVSPILQELKQEKKIMTDPLKAGEYFKNTQFLHAYTDKDKKRIPASIEETMFSYRNALINEVATRNYLLGLYARSYLAERAEGNGIGRYLYGNEVVIDETGDPWSKAYNIVGGVVGVLTGSFESALNTITNTAQTIVNNVVSGVISFWDRLMGRTSSSSAETSSTGSSSTVLADPNSAAGIDTGSSSSAPATTAEPPLCTVDASSTRSERAQLMDCIWDKFITSTSSDTRKTFNFSGQEKLQQRIMVQNIRQMIALNTIMWVRASLEVSTLILLASAQLEMEAIIALNSTGYYWIYPPDNMVWGTAKCGNTSDPTDMLDGTRWTQDCLSEKERLWITPTFDWTEADAGLAGIGSSSTTAAGGK